MKARCPLCGKSAAPDYRPFCGRGCQDRDLLQWLDEGYRLPGGRAGEAAPGAGVDKPYDGE